MASSRVFLGWTLLICQVRVAAGQTWDLSSRLKWAPDGVPGLPLLCTWSVEEMDQMRFEAFSLDYLPVLNDQEDAGMTYWHTVQLLKCMLANVSAGQAD